MISIIVCGQTNTGKTTFIKKFLKRLKRRFFAFDINNEYGQKIMIFDVFLQKIENVKNSIIIFEDATAFLSNRGYNEEIMKHLTFKKHYNNVYIFVFHSLRRIPIYVYEMSNYLILFKTADNPELSSRELKDERLKKIITEIKDLPKYSYKILKIV